MIKLILAPPKRAELTPEDQGCRVEFCLDGVCELMSIEPIKWLGDRVRLLDQTRLPGGEVYLELNGYQDIASAITELKIRGAPAIGIAGAYGVALGALKIKSKSKGEFLEKLQGVISTLSLTRPTAKNLFWAIERMQKVAQSGRDIKEIKELLIAEAEKIHAEEVESSKKMSQFGSELIEDGFRILTHCNTGALAAPSYGTAFGAIRWAKEEGKKIKVYATETRPLLQGARLTCWELKKTQIPSVLITDSMAGYLMSRGGIDCVILGADRIALNGDTANKIGTYTLAVLAKEHGIPFYVVAPTTTVDPTITSGDQIPIEERSPEEVTHIWGVAIAPEGFEALNPAFDVTPHHLISAIVTERGIIREPYIDKLKEVA